RRCSGGSPGRRRPGPCGRLSAPAEWWFRGWAAWNSWRLRARTPRPGGAAVWDSDLHQLLFLPLDHLVDLLDELVGELLDPVETAALVVLGDLLVLLELLDLVALRLADLA